MRCTITWRKSFTHCRGLAKFIEISEINTNRNSEMKQLGLSQNSNLQCL